MHAAYVYCFTYHEYVRGLRRIYGWSDYITQSWMHYDSNNNNCVWTWNTKDICHYRELAEPAYLLYIWFTSSINIAFNGILLPFFFGTTKKCCSLLFVFVVVLQYSYRLLLVVNNYSKSNKWIFFHFQPSSKPNWLTAGVAQKYGNFPSNINIDYHMSSRRFYNTHSIISRII